MFVALLMGVAPILLMPMAMHHAYLLAHDWQLTQIRVDNAAILLAKNDRDLLNFISESNRVLRVLEAIHHPVHRCARIPNPLKGSCAAKDQILEARIRRYLEAVVSKVRVSWTANGLRVQKGLMGIRGTKVHRSIPAPIQMKRCSVCGLENHVAIQVQNCHTGLRVVDPRPLSLKTELIREGNADWNYRLRWLSP